MSATKIDAILFTTVSLFAWADSVHAQTTNPSIDEDQARRLETVSVSGYKQALQSSLERKRNADQVIDAITAEDTGQFPDQNVTEAIQRIAGVQITRRNGSGETVNIRGLSENFTRVELDGRSTAVTIDNANPQRGAILSVFSSDLYQSIEIIKSPTAADIEGGVGGIVRLKTPDPLDIGELAYGFEIAATSADQRDNTEPALTGFYANVSDDGKLGLLLAGTYEKADRSIDKVQANQGWNAVETSDLSDATDPALLELVGGYAPGRIRLDNREGRADKYNVNARLQFHVAEDLMLHLDGTYTLESRERRQSRIQSQFSRGTITGGTLDAATNTILEASFNKVRVEPVSFYRDTDITTYGLTSGFEKQWGDWDFNGEASFTSSQEDFIETRVSARENRNMGYSIEKDPKYPEILFSSGDLDLVGFDVRNLDQQRRIISIEEQAYRFDGEYPLDFDALTSIEAGLRYASTKFDRKQGRVSSPGAGSLTYADGVSGYALAGGFAEGYGGDDFLRFWPSLNPLTLYNMYPSTEGFFDGQNADENLWNLTEDSLAAYGLLRFEKAVFNSWHTRGNVGLRIVQTSYQGEGIIDLSGDAIRDYGNIGTQTMKRDYTDILPAFNLVLSPGEDGDVLIRGAISRALSRPEISDISPGLVLSIDNITTTDADGTIEVGNPNLDPFRAWQYDLGFEWYFGENNSSALTATMFYKDVENFVTSTQDATKIADFVNSTVDQNALGLAANTAGITVPITYEGTLAVNGGRASIQGLEVGFQTPFYFLQEFWSDFGIVANYTFTDSEFIDTSGNTLPFPGSSQNAFNLIGYYEKGGFSGRLSYNYRDPFLIVPGTNNTNNVYNDRDGRVDFALRYKFGNGLRLSFDALNLTEQQNFKYYDMKNRLEDIEVEGRIYQIGLGYRF